MYKIEKRNLEHYIHALKSKDATELFTFPQNQQISVFVPMISSFLHKFGNCFLPSHVWTPLKVNKGNFDTHDNFDYDENWGHSHTGRESSFDLGILYKCRKP